MSAIDLERHDGEDQPDCIGQWCCGCATHPIGKPWGWDHEAWAEHDTACPQRLASDVGRSPTSEEGKQAMADPAETP